MPITVLFISNEPPANLTHSCPLSSLTAFARVMFVGEQKETAKIVPGPEGRSN